MIGVTAFVALGHIGALTCDSLDLAFYGDGLPKTSQNWARLANHFWWMGEKRATELLEGYSIDPNRPIPCSIRRHMLIARLLYEPKAGKILRKPWYGWDHVPAAITESEDWPTLPFIMQDGVIFMASIGFTLFGSPESCSSYLASLKEDGTFRKEPYRVPSQPEVAAALRNLFLSRRWQSTVDVCWTNVLYAPTMMDLRGFLLSQIKGEASYGLRKRGDYRLGVL